MHQAHVLRFISSRALRHPVGSFVCLLPDLSIDTVIRSLKEPVGAAHQQMHSGSSRLAYEQQQRVKQINLGS